MKTQLYIALLCIICINLTYTQDCHFLDASDQNSCISSFQGQCVNLNCPERCSKCDIAGGTFDCTACKSPQLNFSKQQKPNNRFNYFNVQALYETGQNLDNYIKKQYFSNLSKISFTQIPPDQLQAQYNNFSNLQYDNVLENSLNQCIECPIANCGECALDNSGNWYCLRCQNSVYMNKAFNSTFQDVNQYFQNYQNSINVDHYSFFYNSLFNPESDYFFEQGKNIKSNDNIQYRMGFYNNTNSQHIYYQNTPPTYAFDYNQNSCELCPTQCNQCLYDTTTNSFKCQSCSQENHYVDQNGDCQPCTVQNCDKCTLKNTCYPYMCTPPYVYNSQSQSCESCPQQISNGQCLNGNLSCDNGYGTTQISFECRQCSSDCLKCIFDANDQEICILKVQDQGFVRTLPQIVHQQIDQDSLSNCFTALEQLVDGVIQRVLNQSQSNYQFTISYTNVFLLNTNCFTQKVFIQSTEITDYLYKDATGLQFEIPNNDLVNQFGCQQSPTQVICSLYYIIYWKGIEQHQYTFNFYDNLLTAQANFTTVKTEETGIDTSNPQNIQIDTIFCTDFTCNTPLQTQPVFKRNTEFYFKIYIQSAAHQHLTFNHYSFTILDTDFQITPYNYDNGAPGQIIYRISIPLALGDVSLDILLQVVGNISNRRLLQENEYQLPDDYGLSKFNKVSILTEEEYDLYLENQQNQQNNNKNNQDTNINQEKQQNYDEEKQQQKLILMISLIAGGLLLIITITTVICYIKKRKNLKSNKYLDKDRRNSQTGLTESGRKGLKESQD